MVRKRAATRRARRNVSILTGLSALLIVGQSTVLRTMKMKEEKREINSNDRPLYEWRVSRCNCAKLPT